MADPLFQICLMAQMLAGATRASIVRYDSGKNSIEIIQRSSGPTGTLDGKLRLPNLNAKNPVLSVPDIRKVKEFKNHPFMQYMPSLRSLQAYFFQSSVKVEYWLTICNPRPDFFENVQLLNAMEYLAEVVWSILEKPDMVDQHMLDIANMAKLETGLSEAQGGFEIEPTTQFLNETLIRKQRLISRNGASYLALRQWRKPIKPYQIAAMSAVRKHSVRPIADVIAAEMAEAVKRLFGDIFQTIVPMPRDNYKLGNCLAAQITERLAKLLKIQTANVLIPSIKAKSEELLEFTLQRPVSGSVLIVDDVATTGKHMELATKALLKVSGHCTGLVWIAA